MVESIIKRISTRTFSKKDLTKNDIETIKNILSMYQKKSGVFNNQFEFTFNLNDKNDTNGKKIGTYGFLKNVPAFIGGVCKNEKESIIDFGYLFEFIILELTNLGYGTCWLGGTFKRKDYRTSLADNEIIPALSPVGFRADKRSFIDKALRSTAQSNNRLPFNNLFFELENLSPLNREVYPKIYNALLMVQKAPSASNKQPWRMYVIDDTIHLYIERTKGYAKVLNYDIQMLDMGISLTHLEIGLKEEGFMIEYYEENNPKEILNNEYIISIKLK